MNWTTARYVATSAGCLCLHNAIMIACDRSGCTMLQSASVSFCIMVVVGYFLLSRTVFRHAPTVYGFWRYVVAMALNFPVATTLLWIILKGFDFPMVVAAPSAAICMAFLNFFLGRWAVTGRIIRMTRLR